MADHEQQNKPLELSQVEQFCEQENSVNAKPRIEVIEETLKHLEEAYIKTKTKINRTFEDIIPVYLYGEKGVGKTWIAREVTKQAISKKIFDVIIWLYCGKARDGLDEEEKKNLDEEETKNVAYQLSVQQDLSGATAEYYFHNGSNFSRSSRFEFLGQSLKGKRYLLVLDGLERNSYINSDLWEDLLFNSPEVPQTFITSCSETGLSSEDIVVNVNHLTLSESKYLLRMNWNENDIQLLPEDDLDEIVKRCKYLPGAIVFTGNVLLYALNNAPDELNRKLAITATKKKLDDKWMLGCWDGYEKFRDNVIHRMCLYWMCCRDRRMNYNDLILCWILEGFFKNTTSLDKAYTYGYNVLMDLIDAGLLGEREAADVVLETAGKEFGKYLAEVFCEEDTRLFFVFPSMFIGLNNVKRMTGSITGFQGVSGEVKLKTFVVKGNDISKVDQIHIFRKSFGFKELNRLCVSHVMELNLSIFDECDELRVLIIRDCHSLSHIDSIAAHRRLIVLEISGCSSFESFEIPDWDFLVEFYSLKMLNLSGTQIKTLPCLLAKYLNSLVLRNCIYLESFPKIMGSTGLKKLDLSGAKFNSLDMKPWHLEQLPNLVELNLSETNIYEIPDLRQLRSLRYLFSKNCPQLKKLGPLNTLEDLKVIDASGCSELDYFGEENFPSGNSLMKLDLSSTMIPKIPPLKTSSNLIYLCFKGCHQLKELPPFENAKKLRILDVSDAIQLENINCSFEDMEYLQELLLSNTKITTLPPLSGLFRLQKLILRGCESLQSLPEMEEYELIHLLLVDIRGCIALQTLPPFDEHLSDDVVVLRD